MFRKVLIVLSLILTSGVVFHNSAHTHSGRTDANGGHYNRKTGGYHYHNSGTAQPIPQTVTRPNTSGENVMITQQQAHLDAKRDVARDANSASWGVGGFFCGIFAIGASWVHTPTVPAASLIGKSPNYIVFYTQAYQSEMKKRNSYAATTGCLVGAGVYILWVLASE